MTTDFNSIDTIFKKMELDGFDTSKPLRWGFHFIDTNKTNLEDLFNELKDYGYFIDTFEKNNSIEWQLRVVKEDTLDAEKLHKRNLAFNNLAQYCNVKLYDGWDVEKI